MSKERLEVMLELLQKNVDTDCLLAELRERFLDSDVVSRLEGYDITPEIASCPNHVIFYVARYISYLEYKLKERSESENE